MSWYAKTINGQGGQGLVIDEETGDNIAVTYKSKHAALVAAAPELLEALKVSYKRMEQAMLALQYSKNERDQQIANLLRIDMQVTLRAIQKAESEER